MTMGAQDSIVPERGQLPATTSTPLEIKLLRNRCRRVFPRSPRPDGAASHESPHEPGRCPIRYGRCPRHKHEVKS